jgi:hypothetical protein
VQANAFEFNDISQCVLSSCEGTQAPTRATAKHRMLFNLLMVYSNWIEGEGEFIRLPWLGQGGRAAAGCARFAAALRC